MDLVVERSQVVMRLLRRVMKRSVILSTIVILGAAVAFAQPEPSSTHLSNRLLGDAVQMTKAGLSDATIVAYIRARRASLDSILSADDLIRLRRAGVSETVIQYFAGAAAVDVGLSGEGRDEEVTYDSREAGAYPVEPAYDGDDAYPYVSTYYPSYYGGYFSTSVVFVGGRPFFRRHFFFRRPFFRRNIGHRFVQRPFLPRRGFRGFAGPRGSAFPHGSRMAFPPMRGRDFVGHRMRGFGHPR
jgi:hypothetical protein